MCAWCLIYAFNLSNYVALIYDNAFSLHDFVFHPKASSFKFFFIKHILHVRGRMNSLKCASYIQDTCWLNAGCLRLSLNVFMYNCCINKYQLAMLKASERGEEKNDVRRIFRICSHYSHQMRRKTGSGATQGIECTSFTFSAAK